jgi:hypothetical protein
MLIAMQLLFVNVDVALTDHLRVVVYVSCVKLGYDSAAYKTYLHLLLITPPSHSLSPL